MKSWIINSDLNIFKKGRKTGYQFQTPSRSRGYFLYLHMGVCAWTAKFKSKNMDSLWILHPKILWSCIASAKKYGWQFYFSHKFDSKELFLEYYIIEQRENGNCWKFLPPKNGKFMFANFRPKNMAFKWNFRPKTWHAHPCMQKLQVPPRNHRDISAWNSYLFKH